MTRSAVAASARFRQRKLSTRQTLQILREDQLDKVDDETQRNVPKVETGVEKGEEIEHHLQAALSASQAAAIGGKVNQIYIPTPETIQSSIQYDRLYPRVFAQPATYIRFSSTVEDCCGCPYDMDQEDDTFLKFLNSQRNASTQCSEDCFEEVMNFFEETAQAKQPYAAVDSPPVVVYEDMESSFDENISENARAFAKDIYEHWKRRRTEVGNKSLITGLKLETGVETDDADPYVCFRRREVRQVRKTRGRDAQSAEKLKRLRRELEEARQLLALVKQREAAKREQLIVDKLLFDQRSSLRQLKQNLPAPYKEGDEDLLITQKPQKKKPPEPSSSQRPPGTQSRLPPRQDSRSAETDLVLLSDFLAEKENMLQHEIESRLARYKNWDEGYVDLTRAPLTPLMQDNTKTGFRPAMAEYLPTPPASISSEHMGDPAGDDASPTNCKDDLITVRYASSLRDGPDQSQPSFRRRFGRGGRLMIDRRGMNLRPTEGVDDILLDRFKFDHDDDDDEIPVLAFDSFDISRLRYRASICASNLAQFQPSRRPQMEPSPAKRQVSTPIPESATHSSRSRPV